jgi:predicted Zn-dependent protease
MDSLALIWSALEAGATSAAKAVGSTAVKDAYGALHALLRKKLGNKTVSVLADKGSKQAAGSKRQLRKALEETGAHQDREVIEAAQRVMGLADPKQAAAGKYKVVIKGDVQGMVQGANAQVTMNFGTSSTRGKKSHR